MFLKRSERSPRLSLPKNEITGAKKWRKELFKEKQPLSREELEVSEPVYVGV
jgi:hypothetical protein